ncbi:hypothetical protein RJ639_020826 [Escallonia herrerae]|uniref:RING-type domain-containing protein n=1 Tax=Escallonia herrerae TaxID=1293975 RepID=A0AA88V5P1_9ASTE|nr:hypothetical protein RJ639_020826 [Escallonia herrerae]
MGIHRLQERGLKKVKIGHGHLLTSKKQQCSICLEELRVGVEIARTPCFHIVFLNWLKKNLCPLCRSAIPSGLSPWRPTLSADQVELESVDGRETRFVPKLTFEHHDLNFVSEINPNINCGL